MLIDAGRYKHTRKTAHRFLQIGTWTEELPPRAFRDFRRLGFTFRFYLLLNNAQELRPLATLGKRSCAEIDNEARWLLAWRFVDFFARNVSRNRFSILRVCGH